MECTNLNQSSTTSSRGQTSGADQGLQTVSAPPASAMAQRELLLGHDCGTHFMAGVRRRSMASPMKPARNPQVHVKQILVIASDSCIEPRNLRNIMKSPACASTCSPQSSPHWASSQSLLSLYSCMRQRLSFSNMNHNKILLKTSNYSKRAAMIPANIVKPAIDACVADESYTATGELTGGVPLVAAMVPLVGATAIPAAGAAAAPAAPAGETVPAFALAPAPASALAAAPFAPT